MKQFKNIAVSLVLSLVAALILESFILSFTDNQMYECPSDSISAKNLTIDNLNWENIQNSTTILSYDVDLRDVRTLYFKFGVFSWVDSIELLSLPKEKKIVKISNIESSASALLSVPEESKNTTCRVRITGNFVLKDYGVSNHEPDIVKQKIFNPLRILILCTMIFILLWYRNIIFTRIREIQKKDIQKILYFSVKSVGIALIAAIGIWIICSHLEIINVNKYGYIFSVLAGFIISFFVLYGNKDIYHVETLYLLVSCTFILLCVLVYPVFAYGGDSATHFSRSLDVAQVYDEVTFPRYAKLIENGKIDNNNIIESIDTANTEIIHSNNSFKYRIFKNVRYIAYIPFATGLVIADAFNFSPYCAFLFSELCNGWCCCLLIYLGLKKLKFGKMTLILFASLPYIIFLTSRYSYTPWVICWITYASSYAIGCAQYKKPMTNIKDMILIYGSFLIGCLVKAPYLFTVLVTEIIPKENYKDKEGKRISRIFAVLTILILLFSLILPVFIDSRGISMYSDTRGGEGVNAVGQLFNILKNPLWYGRVLIKNILSIMAPNSFIYGANGITSLGTTMRLGHWVKFPAFIILLYIVVILTDKKSSTNNWLSIQNRLFVWILSFINICIICTVMYMNYTEVGKEIIKGINPLYLLTFMFPLFYCGFYIQKNIINIRYRIYNVIIYGIWITLLLLSVLTEIVGAYY